MKTAIEVLNQQIKICDGMVDFFSKELIKFNHITADQTEKLRVEFAQSDNEALKKSCIEAVQTLEAKNIS